MWLQPNLRAFFIFLREIAEKISFIAKKHVFRVVTQFFQFSLKETKLHLGNFRNNTRIDKEYEAKLSSNHDLIYLSVLENFNF